MYYYKARIYSPTLGRFMQTDPIGYSDQINLYSYVENDPLNFRDPTGLVRYDCVVVEFRENSSSTTRLQTKCIKTDDGSWNETIKVAVVKAHRDGNGGLVRDSVQRYSTVIPWYKFGSAEGYLNRYLEQVTGRHSVSDGSGAIAAITSAGGMQRQVERGWAPREVDRVDKGRGPFEKDHVEFNDGRALNNDGTWKHGEGGVSNRVREWLVENGWMPPPPPPPGG